jgi:hypothetical protein
MMINKREKKKWRELERRKIIPRAKDEVKRANYFKSSFFLSSIHTPFAFVSSPRRVVDSPH